MGSLADEPDRESDEGPQTRVTLTKGFFLGTTPVTQGQYEAVMGTNPSFNGTGKDAPVESVSWEDAMAFCKKLTEQERTAGRITTGDAFTLPTEAQWEYACRAGTTGPHVGNLDTMAWYEQNSGLKTHPVGTKLPNAWGLFDMLGNVNEWCLDWYVSYPGGTVMDLTGPASCPAPVFRDGSQHYSGRVFRGGSSGYNAPSVRAASRKRGESRARLVYVGFRIALIAVEPSPQVAASVSQPDQTSPATMPPARVAAPATRTVTGLNLTLQPVPAGAFTMGSPADEPGRHDSEGPQTRVTISQAFWLGKHVVTQGQYEAVMGTNPSHFKNVGKAAPVEKVSWDDAMTFCQKLAERERAARRLPEGYAFTLPTEAQWEYACRAGTTGPYAGNLDAMAWYTKNGDKTTHPVGKKQPNAWGFYDMHGNVLEWCLDWHGVHPGGAVTDPTGAASGYRRVIRGGGWGHVASGCRSAVRHVGSPASCDFYVGFRVALSPVAGRPAARSWWRGLFSAS